jgi:predicted porin
MNKKLVSLAVAAAIAAPTAAMAEAVLYGKLHVSIDYQNVDNAIGNSFDTVDTTSYTGTSSNGVDIGSIYSDSALTTEIGKVEDTSFANITSSSVYVDLDGDGVGEEVMPGAWIQNSATATGIDLSDVTVIKVDDAGNPIVDKTGAADYEGWGINGRSSRGFLEGVSRANRVGVKGSEDLGSGLKAVYQVEFGVQLADTNGNVASGSDNVTMRNSFVGLAGDWGTFLVGRHDTPLKISTGKLDLFGDTMADYNGTVGFQDIRADNAIAYISPSFSGLSFAAATVAPGGTFLGGQNINADSLAEAYSLALIYKNGPWYASAAYEAIGKEMYMDSATSAAGSAGCLNGDGSQTLTCAYVDNDFTKWRLGLGILDWNGFTLTAVYEQQDDIPDGQTREATAFVDPQGNVTLTSNNETKNATLYQISAGYSFGNNMIKGMWGAVDRDNTKLFAASRETTSLQNIRSDLSGDRSTWAIAFDHNFSKRTKAYVLYPAVDDDQGMVPGFGGELWSGFSLGMIHNL